VEEAWELAAVNFFIRFFRDFFKTQARVNQLLFKRPGLVLKTTLLYFGVAAIIFAFNERLRFELYESVGIEGIDPFFFTIGVIVIALVLLSSLPNFFNIVRRTVSTGEELSNDLLRRQLDEIRRNLVTEKDEELSQKLKAQEERIRNELRGFVDGQLRKSDGTLSDDWRDALLLSRNRLSSESEHLKSRSRSNLLWGVLFSIGTVIALVLVVFVFAPETQPASFLWFLFHFGPRATLVIIIQILASFFLRMYVTSEREITRNRNELTNVELRLTAGIIGSNSEGVMAELAKSLVAEERNFIFLKNERIMSANARSDLEEIISATKAISGKKG
jgi:uncharacterized integral membrane protein